MEKIRLNDQYSEIFRAFSMEPKRAVERAIQHYAVTLISEKIDELKRRDQDFREKYECDFKEFATQTAKNEAYLEKLEEAGHWMWESDLAEWEFCRKGMDDWTQRLTHILMS